MRGLRRSPGCNSVGVLATWGHTPPRRYRHPVAQTLLSGFLPFSAIYIELHYIFASIWGHKVYTLFGILALAFVMLIIVTCFVTIAFTYFQLIVEDYHWWWRSFFSGGSTGIIVFGELRELTLCASNVTPNARAFVNGR